jgi:hypothetical protein
MIRYRRGGDDWDSYDESTEITPDELDDIESINKSLKGIEIERVKFLINNDLMEMPFSDVREVDFKMIFNVVTEEATHFNEIENKE